MYVMFHISTSTGVGKIAYFGREADPVFKVTTFNNETYPTNITAPSFTATWQYPIGPETEPVHAFPNAKLNLPGVIPVQLSAMTGLNVNTNWTYGLGDSTAPTNDDAALSGE